MPSSGQRPCGVHPCEHVRRPVVLRSKDEHREEGLHNPVERHWIPAFGFRLSGFGFRVSELGSTAGVPQRQEEDGICLWSRVSGFFFFFFTLVTGPRRSLSLKLSDANVYEPQIRARLGNHNTTSRGLYRHQSPRLQKGPSSLLLSFRACRGVINLTI